MRYDIARHTPALSLGGGLKYAFASRWAWRIDARAQFTTSEMTIAIDASPQTNSATARTVAFATATNPSVQFGTALGPGTLSGPVLDDFVTFEGRARQQHFSVTTGLAFRF